MTTPPVGLAGDWHGDTPWARYAVHTLAEAGCTTLHHLGDFGVWSGPGGQAYLTAVANACTAVGLTIYVTPGNHEDYTVIEQLSRLDRGRRAGPARGPGPQRLNPPNTVGGDPASIGWLSDHIGLLPRGYRWRYGGRRFVSLGGAPSVDVHQRLPGRDWWAAEAVTESDLEAVESGGHAEVFLAHDAPHVSTAAVGRIIATNPAGWPESALAYAARGRDAMTRAFAAVRPLLYVHGHYHVADESVIPMSANAPGAVGSCHVVALSDERTPGNLAVLDPRDLSVRRLP